MKKTLLTTLLLGLCAITMAQEKLDARKPIQVDKTYTKADSTILKNVLLKTAG